jgi:CubicO group peptidase (beta-lactamase class C family)
MHPRSSRVVRFVLCAAAFAAVPRAAAAQHRGKETARTADLKAHPRDDVIARLRDSLQSIMDRGVVDSAFPGGIVIVGSHAGPLVTVASGRLDWAPSPAPTMTTIWDLASLTKVVGMTSAMMQLVEAGTVDLDAPVQRYLPEWTGRWKDRVTVRDLLTHRSGLPAFKQYYKLNASPDSTLRLMMTTPLDTMPGVRMVYSDIGAITLGKIVERVSGETLDRYLAEHVFGPLGMVDTRYRPDSSLLPRIAPTEVDPWRGRHLRGEVHDENAAALGGVSAHAGLFSTGHDLDRLARAYLSGGAIDGARLAKAATIRQFTTVQDSAFSSRAIGWDTPPGAGSGHFLRHPAFGHTGYTGTSLWIDPSHDLYVILLTNRVNPTREHSRIGAVRTAVTDATMRLLYPGVVASIQARAAASTHSPAGRP